MASEGDTLASKHCINADHRRAPNLTRHAPNSSRSRSVASPQSAGWPEDSDAHDHHGRSDAATLGVPAAPRAVLRDRRGGQARTASPSTRSTTACATPSPTDCVRWAITCRWSG